MSHGREYAKFQASVEM